MIITWTVCEIDTIQGQKVLQRREMHMGKRCRGERCKGEPDKEKCMGGGGGGSLDVQAKLLFSLVSLFS
jgi:hypothetical protein